MNGKLDNIRLRVRAVAESKGISTPVELAEFLGVVRSVAERLWAGEPIPRLDRMVVYADKLGVPLDSLYEHSSPHARRRAVKIKRQAEAAT